MSEPSRSFWSELKRRHAVKVVVTYVVVGTAVGAVAETFLPNLGAPGWVLPTVLGLLVLGLPVALVLAWAYEVTPEGIVRDPSDSAAKAPSAEGSASDERKSIVVLPFDNMSPDPGDAYFADGLTEEIITDLSYLRSLRVISRNSAMVLKDTQMSTRAIAEELGVQYVLEGSVRRAGDDLRITAQLIDGRTDEHLWAERYEGVLDDVFGIQEETSRAIVQALKVQFTPDEGRRLSVRPINNLRAYECYLRARREFYTLAAGSEDRAIELLDRALELEGENELLFAWKGFGLFQLVNSMSRPPSTFEQLLNDARRNAERALALNPMSSFGNCTLGYVYANSVKPRRAIRHFAEALRIDPDNTDALLYAGFMAAIGGWDHDGAHAALEKLAALDPLTPISSGALGWLHWGEGNFAAAISEFEQFHRVAEEGKSPFRVFLAYLQAENGGMDEAIRIADQMTADSPGHPLTTLAAFLRSAWMGRPKEALAEVTGDLREGALWDDIWPLMMASGYALCGDEEAGYFWLEHAIDSGFASAAYLRRADPFLEGLRGGDRFEELMNKADQTAASIAEEIELSDLI